MTSSSNMAIGVTLLIFGIIGVILSVYSSLKEINRSNTFPWVAVYLGCVSFILGGVGVGYIVQARKEAYRRM